MVKRKDLSDIADADRDLRRLEYMMCQDCGEKFGGTRGDYFMMAMDEKFVCPECSSDNIALVRDVFKTVVVKQ